MQTLYSARWTLMDKLHDRHGNDFRLRFFYLDNEYGSVFDTSVEGYLFSHEPGTDWYRCFRLSYDADFGWYFVEIE